MSLCLNGIVFPLPVCLTFGPFCLLTEGIAIKLDKWDRTDVPFSSQRAPDGGKKSLILLLGGTARAAVNAFLSWWQVLSRPKRAQAFRPWPQATVSR